LKEGTPKHFALQHRCNPAWSQIASCVVVVGNGDAVGPILMPEVGISEMAGIVVGCGVLGGDLDGLLGVDLNEVLIGVLGGDLDGLLGLCLVLCFLLR